MPVISKTFSKVLKVAKNKVASKITNKVETVKSNVKSSNLKTVEYNDAKRILTITFLRGNRKYQYFGVPKRTYTSLMTAHSKGVYFDTWIRYKYQYKEI